MSDVNKELYLYIQTYELYLILQCHKQEIRLHTIIQLWFGIVQFDEDVVKHYKKEFEDTKRAIRIRISKKSRQHNGQRKKYKRTNNDLQNIHIKLNIE
jgi:hypothetical protein